MSTKAYYYCKNFSFKEINNLFSYGVKDPSRLTKHQKLIRLYKNSLRKIQNIHLYKTKDSNYEAFLEEARKLREDFEKLQKTKDEREVEVMVEKYELMIERYFQPYVSMHESRMHSNNAGKLIVWGEEALLTDHHGYYSQNVLVAGRPNEAAFNEEYPHMQTAWMYENLFIDETFDYREEGFIEQGVPESSEKVRKQLDDLHR